ncbi:hypothetical protein LOK74_06975 [Brevibacillus humidisoli]|uniref:putative amidoligase domain-containing protein n=1 Tax=Brevibacillus humidisoli TaxID=2895522 RepID=UPI001E62489A|nr:hypothetical protein [Brevibacillus humidisoli]UFJ42232.1 hypothetical protein LOK74_06975 [Brevibacillus humidisoli]
MVETTVRPNSDNVSDASGIVLDDTTLNRRHAVDLCKQYMPLLSVLRMNGIPVLPISRQRPGESRKPGPARRYYVHLFQQHLLCLLRAETPSVWLHRQAESRESLRFSQTIHLPDDPEQKQVQQLAVRSLYAAGLDYGAVYLGAYSPNRIRVLDVHPTPLGDRNLLLPLYREACERYRQQQIEEEHTRPEVVLGADPEYALRDPSGQIGIASRFLPKRGMVGCDAARLRDAPLSREHPLVELRPDPSDDPDVLFAHIRHALHKAANMITDRSLEWIAGGMPFPEYPIGGHIHFSGVSFSFQLVRALDTYLTLPLALVEDPGCRERRPRYGFLGDFRLQPYGGFEYRTPPSWLVTPIVTRGVLSLAKLIAANYRQLRQQPLGDPRVQRAYYTGDAARLRPIVEQLWGELVWLPQYDRFRQALDPLFDYLWSETVWPADKDFRSAWDLPSALNKRRKA